MDDAARSIERLHLTQQQKRSLTLLGSTGSVGSSTLDLVRQHPGQFEVLVLTANRSVELLVQQALEFRPRLAVVADEGSYSALKEGLAGSGVEAAAGKEALRQAAAMDSDLMVAAIVGAAGLAPVLEGLKRGAVIALANKETLVCAGDLMTAQASLHGATLLPVDSEHNAIYQVFDFERRDAIEGLILTASGGPFRSLGLADMRSVTPEMAVAHPNWSMGAKISVDSATMMNKGLEIIEAKHLFDMPEERIEVLVHPQSVIHSLVRYCDGSLLAQLGQPDMRTPLAYAMAWPERMSVDLEPLDLTKLARLDFEAPDEKRFPALRLAREAMRAGQEATAVLNAANEEAVAAFLAGRTGFLQICELVEQTLDEITIVPSSCLEDLLDLDRQARGQVRQFVENQ